MPKQKETILIMDDEPHVLEWLVEYLESKNYVVRMVSSVDEAIGALNDGPFRVAIFDLNVPASDAILHKLEGRSGVHVEFRGLYAAEYARTKGLRGKQVIVYSVHDSEDVMRRCEQIGVQYLIKARPREFKRELDNVLSFDPTKN